MHRPEFVHKIQGGDQPGTPLEGSGALASQLESQRANFVGKGLRSGIALSAAKSFAAVNLTEPCAYPAEPLKLMRHSGHMNPNRPARPVLIFVLVFLAACCIASMIPGVQISENTWPMIKFIVELAQLY